MTTPVFLTVRLGLWLSAALSAAMLLAALVAQYGFHLHPCDLCILQRYPYAAIVVIGVIGARWVRSAGARRIALVLCAALFFVDAGIAFYHTGVEIGWFPGPSGCASDSHGGESLEALRRQILAAPLVTCDQAMAHIFGLSLAAWNGLAATSAALAATWAAWKGRP